MTRRRRETAGGGDTADTRRLAGARACGGQGRLTRQPRSGESGFALLLVFALSAAVAIMLYIELPRVAFEAQRNKEEMLIERGGQYQRAIQLYFRKFKQYPGTMEQLENTNNVRFLRRRYNDPLTGKSEWRLIHVGPGGVFTDSLTRKPKAGDKDKKDEYKNTFITEGPSIGGTASDVRRTSGGPARRKSEGGGQTQGTDGLNSGQFSASGGDPNQAFGGDPSAAGAAVPGVPQNPVSAFPGAPAVPFDPNAPQQAGVGTPGGGVQQPGVGQMPGGFGQPGMGQPGMGQPGMGQPGMGQPGMGQPGMGQPGMDPNQANQAADLIRNLLTRPRPFPGSPQGAGAGMGGSQIGGGIAGVASKVERQSIKIYNERDQYNEWEFIYDFAKDRTGMGQMAGTMGSGDPRLGQQGGNGAPGAAGFGAQQSGFGGQSAFGQQSGFGSSTAATGNPAGSPSGGQSGNGGIGSGFGGTIGSGYGNPTTTPAPTRQPPQQHAVPPQPTPQPGAAPPTPPAPTPAAPATPPAPTPQPAPIPEPTPEPPAPEPSPDLPTTDPPDNPPD